MYIQNQIQKIKLLEEAAKNCIIFKLENEVPHSSAGTVKSCVIQFVDGTFIESENENYHVNAVQVDKLTQYIDAHSLEQTQMVLERILRSGKSSEIPSIGRFTPDVRAAIKVALNTL